MNSGADHGHDRKFAARAYHVYRIADGAIVLSHTFLWPEEIPHDVAATERTLLADASRRFNISAEKLAVHSRDAAHPVVGTILRVDPATRELVLSEDRNPLAVHRSQRK